MALVCTNTKVVKVSLDPATKKPVPVNPLVTNTPEEKLLFQQGEANYNLKKAESKMALRKQTPNDEESDLIHALWLRQLDYHGTNSSRTLLLSYSPSNHQPQTPTP
jgi:acyl-coenzyme A thioesterase 9